MDFLNEILSSNSDEEVDKLISNRIKQMNNTKEQINQFGFLNNNKMINYYKGFIPLNTKIKYSSIAMETYSMNTTDFFYDFAHYIRINSINSKKALVYSIEKFINLYFGYPGETGRETIFDEIAWKSTKTDEEYFEALENNKIGDLKGMGAAECTERSALAQQLLSMFDIESYYCFGCINLNNNSIAHCFNIIKTGSDYALLDYSIPIPIFNDDNLVQGYIPFIGIISNEEFENFIETNEIKSFLNYEYNKNKRNELDSYRKYVVGKFEIIDKKTNKKL